MAVTTTTANVMAGCAIHNQRHRERVARIRITATMNAQPTCRLGIAANWFAIPDWVLGPYTDCPRVTPVPTQPGSNRGGASGKNMCPIKANPVSEASAQRAFPYSAGRRIMNHSSTTAREREVRTRVERGWRHRPAHGFVSTAKHGDITAVDAVATYDEGKLSVFLVNRSTEGPIEVTVDVSRAGVTTIAEAVTMHDDDRLATNSAEQPDRITPQPNESVRLEDGKLIVTLPAISWTALSLSTD